MKHEANPLSRKENLLIQELAGETLIYDLLENQAYCLNETSSFIWQLCDGNKTVREITESVGKELKHPVTEDLVWLAIIQFKKDELLADNSIKIPKSTVYRVARL